MSWLRVSMVVAALGLGCAAGGGIGDQEQEAHFPARVGSGEVIVEEAPAALEPTEQAPVPVVETVEAPSNVEEKQEVIPQGSSDLELVVEPSEPAAQPTEPARAECTGPEWGAFTADGRRTCGVVEQCGVRHVLGECDGLDLCGGEELGFNSPEAHVCAECRPSDDAKIVDACAARGQVAFHGCRWEPGCTSLLETGSDGVARAYQCCGEL